jgi:peptidoglycan/xylan/chitin deacetylase (PgdA/CDA1 family)
MTRRVLGFFLVTALLLGCDSGDNVPGTTIITKWQHGKAGAVSITYDDGTINQFRIARPIMNERGLPGTFYVPTGAMPTSEHKGEFIGRPSEEIIAETATDPTDESNFFERASAVRYLGYQDAHKAHREAGSLFEQGEVEEAYDVIDETYRKVRNGEYVRKDGSWSYPLSPYVYSVIVVEPGGELLTWEDLKSYNGEFHEFGSHTVTHPYLAVLDEANIMYELQRSKEAIRTHLGEEHTFSAELPFGTKDERVMQYGHEVYPALRNRMPEPYLTEIPRGSDIQPDTTTTPYTLWQRGPLSDTPMDEMKSWVDVTQSNDNIWLVLVFHGIEGIGWEPLSEAEITEYFDYIEARTDNLWVATYADGTKYIRERMDAHVSSEMNNGAITVQLTHSLGPQYDLPLTLKTRVPSSWPEARVQQGDITEEVDVLTEDGATYVMYQARPNAEPIELTAP